LNSKIKFFKFQKLNFYNQKLKNFFFRYTLAYGEGGQWVVDQMPLNKHEASVEDIYGRPQMLVSYSINRSNRLWDTRARPADACVHTVANAHDKDVNVLSWNKFDPLLVTEVMMRS
jgi:hypothetical protein